MNNQNRTSEHFLLCGSIYTLTNKKFYVIIFLRIYFVRSKNVNSLLTASTSLLVNGTEAFPEILNCIEKAQKSIEINMFIWRGDNIGKTVAQAVLNAAEREVKVFISVDRYGLVLEKCEECTHSFFHEKPTLQELIKIKTLEFFYPFLADRNAHAPDHIHLLEKMLSHPNIKISRDIFKADHSKYYVFDEKILILGGINIEDKENGCDIAGRQYQDYMVKISDPDTVKNFRLKLDTGKNSDSDIRFTVNNKSLKPAQFEAEELLLKVINEAQKELLIIMAYFSPLPRFIKAIHNAWRRGVKITVIIPEHANFQDDLNRKTVKKLMKICNNGLNLYFYKGMIHTKLLYNEKILTMGSTNITKKAFKQLTELNLTLERKENDFFKRLDKSIENTISDSIKITKEEDIKYNIPMTVLESLFV